MKKIALILAFVMVLTGSLPVFADGNASVYESYTNSVIAEDLNSDEYIQRLINSGIEFEVIDIYYTPMSSQKRTTEKTVLVKGVLYVETKTIKTINKMPEPQVSISPEGSISMMVVTSSDVRIREVLEQGGRIKASSKSGTISNLTITTFMIAYGLYSTIGGTILSIIQSLGTPVVNYGNSIVDTYYSHAYNNRWYEILTSQGYTPMIISESRHTNCSVFSEMYNKVTQHVDTGSKAYNDIMIEYASNYTNMTTCINLAVQRYNLGYTEPATYSYGTGLVIDNSSKMK